MAATIESVTTTWRLDPPVDVLASYQRPDAKAPRLVRVTVVERHEFPDEREEYWSVSGIPLTAKGNPNGGQDHRYVDDDALASLRALVLEAE